MGKLRGLLTFPAYVTLSGMGAPARIPESVPKHWIRIEKVAALLGCSRRTVERLEEAGHVHGKMSRDGYCYYDPVLVAELATIYTPQNGRPKVSARLGGVAIPRSLGARQARIAELLKSGLDAVAVVIQLRCSFEEVHDVHEWMQKKLGDVLPKKEKREREERKMKVSLARSVGATLRAEKENGHDPRPGG